MFFTCHQDIDILVQNQDFPDCYNSVFIILRSKPDLAIFFPLSTVSLQYMQERLIIKEPTKPETLISKFQVQMPPVLLKTI